LPCSVVSSSIADGGVSVHKPSIAGIGCALALNGVEANVRHCCVTRRPSCSTPLWIVIGSYATNAKCPALRLRITPGARHVMIRHIGISSACGRSIQRPCYWAVVNSVAWSNRTGRATRIHMLLCELLDRNIEIPGLHRSTDTISSHSMSIAEPQAPSGGA
jgi:hypothetical protein